MKTSESINELAAALAKAQAEMRNPERNRTVKVKTRTGGEYTFDYATLDSILDGVREPLTKNGLCLSQPADTLENGTITLTTRLMHASGQFMESTVPVRPTDDDPQSLGSALTYIRRYSLITLLGLAAEEDDDGNHASGNISEPTKREPLPNCPDCGHNRSVIKGKAEYGGGFVCYKQKDGCGKKWQPGEENAESETKPKSRTKKTEAPADELSANDNLVVAQVVHLFSETESESDFAAICDMIKMEDSMVSKCENPEKVKEQIRKAIKGHRHTPKKKDQPEYEHVG